MSERSAFVIALAALLGIGLQHRASHAECLPDSFVIDTIGSTTSVAAIWGEAPGQTFVPSDTLISAITVWRRREQDVSLTEMKLWIVEVDSTGRPRNDRVVLDGPTLRGIVGDGIHPVEVRFTLNPPVVLPRRGKYAFLVQNLCEWFFDLLIRDGTTYPAGELWRSEVSNTRGCVLWGIFDHFDDYDLCCKIEYCRDRTTPVVRSSWGRLKTIYR